MKRFYVFKDGTQQGSKFKKEEVLRMIQQLQKLETHPILRSEFSIIYGEEEFIPYPKLAAPQKRQEKMR